MCGFEHPQALVEIGWVVGVDDAGRFGGPHLVAVEFVTVIGRSF